MQARIDQIEKITTESQRTLTALERARLQQLQDMQNNDKKAADEKSKESKFVGTRWQLLVLTLSHAPKGEKMYPSENQKRELTVLCLARCVSVLSLCLCHGAYVASGWFPRRSRSC